MRRDIPRNTLIKALARDINKLQDLTPQEKILFANEESIEKLLSNPELEIVLSIKELEGLKSQMEEKAAQVGVKGNKSMLSTRGKLLMTSLSRAMVENVSEMIIKDAIGKFIKTTSRKYVSESERAE